MDYTHTHAAGSSPVRVSDRVRARSLPAEKTRNTSARRGMRGGTHLSNPARPFHPTSPARPPPLPFAPTISSPMRDLLAAMLRRRTPCMELHKEGLAITGGARPQSQWLQCWELIVCSRMYCSPWRLLPNGRSRVRLNFVVSLHTTDDTGNVPNPNPAELF